MKVDLSRVLLVLAIRADEIRKKREVHARNVAESLSRTFLEREAFGEVKESMQEWMIAEARLQELQCIIGMLTRAAAEAAGSGRSEV